MLIRLSALHRALRHNRATLSHLEYQEETTKSKIARLICGLASVQGLARYAPPNVAITLILQNVYETALAANPTRVRFIVPVLEEIIRVSSARCQKVPFFGQLF